jgi:hypothetical protein
MDRATTSPISPGHRCRYGGRRALPLGLLSSPVVQTVTKENVH